MSWHNTCISVVEKSFYLFTHPYIILQVEDLERYSFVYKKLYLLKNLG